MGSILEARRAGSHAASAPTPRQHDGSADERRRVARLDAKDQRRDESRYVEAQRGTNRDAEDHKSGHSTQHQSNDGPSIGPQCHPDPDLRSPAADAVRRDAVKPDAGQQQRECSEEGRENRDDPLANEPCLRTAPSSAGTPVRLADRLARGPRPRSSRGATDALRSIAPSATLRASPSTRPAAAAGRSSAACRRAGHDTRRSPRDRRCGRTDSVRRRDIRCVRRMVRPSAFTGSQVDELLGKCLIDDGDGRRAVAIGRREVTSDEQRGAVGGEVPGD